MPEQDKILNPQTPDAAIIAAEKGRVASEKNERDHDDKEHAPDSKEHVHELKDTTLGNSLKFAQVDSSKFSEQAKEALIQFGSKTVIRASDIEAGAATATLLNPSLIDDVIDGGGEKKKQEEAEAKQKLIDDIKLKEQETEKSIKAAEETKSMFASLNRLAEELVSDCKQMFTDAKQWFDKKIEGLQKWWDEFSFTDSCSNVWQSVKESSFGKFVSNSYEKAADFLSHPMDSLVEMKDRAVNKVKEFVGPKIVNGVKSFVDHPIDSVIGLFSDEPEQQLAQGNKVPNPQRVSAPQKDVQELSAKVKEASLQLGDKLAQNNIGKITDVQDVSAPHVGGGGHQRSAGSSRLASG